MKTKRELEGMTYDAATIRDDDKRGRYIVEVWCDGVSAGFFGDLTRGDALDFLARLFGVLS